MAEAGPRYPLQTWTVNPLPVASYTSLVGTSSTVENTCLQGTPGVNTDAIHVVIYQKMEDSSEHGGATAAPSVHDVKQSKSKSRKPQVSTAKPKGKGAVKRHQTHSLNGGKKMFADSKENWLAIDQSKTATAAGMKESKTVLSRQTLVSFASRNPLTAQQPIVEPSSQVFLMSQPSFGRDSMARVSQLPYLCNVASLTTVTPPKSSGFPAQSFSSPKASTPQSKISLVQKQLVLTPKQKPLMKRLQNKILQGPSSGDPASSIATVTVHNSSPEFDSKQLALLKSPLAFSTPVFSVSSVSSKGSEENGKSPLMQSVLGTPLMSLRTAEDQAPDPDSGLGSSVTQAQLMLEGGLEGDGGATCSSWATSEDSNLQMPVVEKSLDENSSSKDDGEMNTSLTGMRWLTKFMLSKKSAAPSTSQATPEQGNLHPSNCSTKRSVCKCKDRTNEPPKPDMHYKELIQQALLSKNDYCMTAKDIREWLIENYPYYEFHKLCSFWKNALRHSLSSNSSFKRHPLKKNHWELDFSVAQGSADHSGVFSVEARSRPITGLGAVGKTPLGQPVGQQLILGPSAVPGLVYNSGNTNTVYQPILPRTSLPNQVTLLKLVTLPSSETFVPASFPPATVVPKLPIPPLTSTASSAAPTRGKRGRPSMATAGNSSQGAAGRPRGGATRKPRGGARGRPRGGAARKPAQGAPGMWPQNATGTRRGTTRKAINAEIAGPSAKNNVLLQAALQSGLTIETDFFGEQFAEMDCADSSSSENTSNEMLKKPLLCSDPVPAGRLSSTVTPQLGPAQEQRTKPDWLTTSEQVTQETSSSDDKMPNVGSSRNVPSSGNHTRRVLEKGKNGAFLSPASSPSSQPLPSLLIDSSDRLLSQDQFSPSASGPLALDTSTPAGKLKISLDPLPSPIPGDYPASDSVLTQELPECLLPEDSSNKDKNHLTTPDNASKKDNLSGLVTPPSSSLKMLQTWSPTEETPLPLSMGMDSFVQIPCLPDDLSLDDQSVDGNKNTSNRGPVGSHVNQNSHGSRELGSGTSQQGNNDQSNQSSKEGQYAVPRMLQNSASKYSPLLWRTLSEGSSRPQSQLSNQQASAENYLQNITPQSDTKYLRRHQSAGQQISNIKGPLYALERELSQDRRLPDSSVVPHGMMDQHHLSMEPAGSTLRHSSGNWYSHPADTPSQNCLPQSADATWSQTQVPKRVPMDKGQLSNTSIRRSLLPQFEENERSLHTLLSEGSMAVGREQISVPQPAQLSVQGNAADEVHTPEWLSDGAGGSQQNTGQHLGYTKHLFPNQTPMGPPDHTIITHQQQVSGAANASETALFGEFSSVTAPHQHTEKSGLSQHAVPPKVAVPQQMFSHMQHRLPQQAFQGQPRFPAPSRPWSTMNRQMPPLNYQGQQVPFHTVQRLPQSPQQTTLMQQPMKDSPTTYQYVRRSLPLNMAEQHRPTLHAYPNEPLSQTHPHKPNYHSPQNQAAFGALQHDHPVFQGQQHQAVLLAQQHQPTFPAQETRNLNVYSLASQASALAAQGTQALTRAYPRQQGATAQKGLRQRGLSDDSASLTGLSGGDGVTGTHSTMSAGAQNGTPNQSQVARPLVSISPKYQVTRPLATSLMARSPSGQPVVVLSSRFLATYPVTIPSTFSYSSSPQRPSLTTMGKRGAKHELQFSPSSGEGVQQMKVSSGFFASQQLSSPASARSSANQHDLRSVVSTSLAGQHPFCGPYLFSSPQQEVMVSPSHSQYVTYVNSNKSEGVLYENVVLSSTSVPGSFQGTVSSFCDTGPSSSAVAFSGVTPTQFLPIMQKGGSSAELRTSGGDSMNQFSHGNVVSISTPTFCRTDSTNFSGVHSATAVTCVSSWNNGAMYGQMNSSDWAKQPWDVQDLNYVSAELDNFSCLQQLPSSGSALLIPSNLLTPKPGNSVGFEHTFPSTMASQNVYDLPRNAQFLQGHHMSYPDLSGQPTPRRHSVASTSRVNMMGSQMGSMLATSSSGTATAYPTHVDLHSDLADFPDVEGPQSSDGEFLDKLVDKSPVKQLPVS